MFTQFTPVIQRLDDNNLETRLDEALTDLVKAIHKHQEGGELTLTLKLKPYSRGVVKADPEDPDPVAINAEIKVKAPKAPITGLQMWTDEHGLLLRDQPQAPCIPGLEPVSGHEPSGDPEAEQVEEKVTKQNFA